MIHLIVFVLFVFGRKRFFIFGLIFLRFKNIVFGKNENVSGRNLAIIKIPLTGTAVTVLLNVCHQ